MSRNMAPRRPIFLVRIEGKPGAEGIRQLRAFLKHLLRAHGFRCLETCEVPTGK
jgi:hypothetical protein